MTCADGRDPPGDLGERSRASSGLRGGCRRAPEARMIPRFEPTAGIGETLAFLAGLPGGGDTGEEVGRFEEEFARRQGGGYALFVSSGRLGLLLALRALDYP